MPDESALGAAVRLTIAMEAAAASGGHPWRSTEIIELMTAARLGSGREVARTWSAPVRMYAAQRSS
jgi:hypothetical protein